jgi:hypothetical protein
MNRRDFLKTSSTAAVGAVAVSMTIPTLQAEEVPLLGKLIKPMGFQEVYKVEWLAYQQEYYCMWSSNGKTYNQRTSVMRMSELAREDMTKVMRDYIEEEAKYVIKKTIKETKKIG